jgi:hypothetical protein
MMPNDERNVDGCDRTDASALGDNDPPTRGRSLKALEQETELKFEHLEATNTGGAEHQDRDERRPEHERPLKDHSSEALPAGRR